MARTRAGDGIPAIGGPGSSEPPRSGLSSRYDEHVELLSAHGAPTRRRFSGSEDAAPGVSERRSLVGITPSASYSFTVRLEIKNKPGMLGRVTSVIGKAGGDIGAVDLAEMTPERVLRDI